MKIIPVNEPLFNGNEEKYLIDCIKSGWISSAGKYIERFEKEWSSYCGRKYGVAVANGTVALELAVSSLNLPKGGEVILPSFTIISCAEAVLRNDMKPVLVDCESDTYCMNLDEVEKRITKNTVAIMPVHIYGHPVGMDKLIDIAKKHQLKVIEDAAEAHGAECLVDGKWQRCGSFGDLSAFSFYANKNITTGEGGMVLTDDDELVVILRKKRNLYFGEKERFCHEERGSNFRMTNLQAAIGCAQLEDIEKHLERKLSIARRYDEGLGGLPLQLPQNKSWARSSVWMYAVLLSDKLRMNASDFTAELLKRGVQTRPFFRGIHTQPCYRNMGLFLNEHYPVTEHIYERGLYLPSGQAITDEQIDDVIEAIQEVLK